MNTNPNMSNTRLRVSPVCDNREEPSASLKDLPNDVLKYCFSFIPGSYVTVGPVSKHFYSNYSTLGIHESASFNSAETLLEIGKNRRTTADAVSSDLRLTEYCFIIGAPEEFMEKVCCMAAIKSRRDIIECSKAFGINCNKVFESNDIKIMLELVREDNLDMMNYLLEKFRERQDWSWIVGVFHTALRKGYLHVLQWLHKSIPDCLSFGDVLSDGNSATIKWFIENVDFDEDNQTINEYIAYRGKLEIFEAIEGHYQPVFNEKIFNEAAEGCSIEMLDYLYRNNCPFNRDICSNVFENSPDASSSFEALKWLHCHNFPLNAKTCAAAAFYDNLRALKWARDQGCPWDEKTLVNAASMDGWNSNMQILEYCLQNGCPLSSSACQSAMKNMDYSKALEVLKLLRKHSCPWDEETCQQAASWGNFEALIWARSNGCPWNPTTFLKVLKYGSASIIEYFLRSENQLLSLDGIFEAIFDSRTKGTCPFESSTDPIASDDSIIAKLKLLHSFGLQLTTQACALASRRGRLRVLQWLKYMDCLWDVEM